ncbi:MAG: hypothetical protein WC449_01540 [Candidatus Paceibacterota bacterium]
MAEPQIYEVTADQNGNWEVNLPNTFGNGVHAVTAIDQDGNKDAVVVDIKGEPETKTVVQEKIVTQEVVKEIMPQGLFLWVTLLYLTAMLVSLGMIYFSRKAKEQDGSQSKAKGVGLVFGVLVMILATVLYIYASYSFGLIKSLALKDNIMQASLVSLARQAKEDVRHINIEGIVTDPTTKQGLEGVSISAGSTVVKTPKGGEFALGSIVEGEGVKIDYPVLSRPLRYKAKEGKQEIIFDPMLYNAAIKVTDLEAHNKVDGIYLEMLSTANQQKLSLDEFVKNYQKGFNKLNEVMPELIVLDANVHSPWSSPQYAVQYPMVVELKLGNGQGGESNYFFALEEGMWKLVQ